VSDKSKAQEIYERVEAVVKDQGITKKEAQVIVGKEFDMKPSSIRGAEYQARKELGLTRTRVQETTPDNAVASAIATLEKARDAIDDEVDAAKDRADEAGREYKVLKDSAADRKAEIETKIEALKA
jgi:molecular chaperone DnaK (HSP70)